MLAAAAVALPMAVPSLLPDDERPDRVASGVPVKGMIGPSWLPPGFHEVRREHSSARGDVLRFRIWSTGSTSRDPEPRTYISMTANDYKSLPKGLGTPIAPDKPSKPGPGIWIGSADINGSKAMVLRRPDRCTVSWVAPDLRHRHVNAVRTKDRCGIALRVARSLTGDPSATVTDTIRVAGKPDDRFRIHRTEEKTGSGCVASVDFNAENSLLLYIGPSRPVDEGGHGSVVRPRVEHPADRIEYEPGGLPQGGAPLRVGGRPARYYESFREIRSQRVLVGQKVVIDLGGRRLIVTKRHWARPEAKQPLIQFAGKVGVGSPPTCSW
ncbi:hypothetical protein [Thermomonospora umbrina]|uniref:hypothetical protein n=1 Tax=Thermomonospora umbrina TaxID=111806 RepID=UPI0011C0EF45|nr:hypothetical protein [Thermomonospora umbrina]